MHYGGPVCSWICLRPARQVARGSGCVAAVFARTGPVVKYSGPTLEKQTAQLLFGRDGPSYEGGSSVLAG